MQPTQNNLATEIILGVVAGPMAIAAPVLLYLGTINLGGALTIWGIAAGLVVGKLALNAPSSTQQAQIGTLQAQQSAQTANLQSLVQYALSLVQSLQAPVAPPSPQQTAQPVQPVTSAPDPVVPPVASSSATTNPSEEYTAWVKSHPIQQPPSVPPIPVPGPPQPQFKPPVPVAVEHPPIDSKDMVNTFPELPIFGQQAQQQ